MTHITFSAEEIKNNAVKEMENCMAYLSIGDNKTAHICYGSAAV